jgi:hypothetical protein
MNSATHANRAGFFNPLDFPDIFEHAKNSRLRFNCLLYNVKNRCDCLYVISPTIVGSNEEEYRIRKTMHFAVVRVGVTSHWLSLRLPSLCVTDIGFSYTSCQGEGGMEPIITTAKKSGLLTLVTC